MPYANRLRLSVRSERGVLSHFHVLLILLALGTRSLASEDLPDKLKFFEEKIRPVLADNCYSCHSAKAEKLKAQLYVDSREGLRKGGESGIPAVVPGEPDKSLLLKAIRYEDPDLQMPPKKKLSERQIADFAQWIKDGAEDPRTVSPSLEQHPDAAVEFSEHWAFQRPDNPEPPTVQNRAWIRSPVDNFVLASLESRKLSPAQPASKQALIRRATFDLIGLPPTPAEIDEFERDHAPDAFAKVVDRLLSSPLYGQRWARHWLDVVRYADARDLIQLPAESDFREVWRYRDWVVKAFNHDFPYSEFIRYQLAGDLLQPDASDAINQDGIVATGFLALADFIPGDNDKDMMIADYVNDQIDVTGRTFLGLTLGCARCHNHKFDPISIEDYYGLAGIFFSTRLVPSPVAGNTPLVRVPLLPKRDLDRIESAKRRVQELDVEIQDLNGRLKVEYYDFLENQAAILTDDYLRALTQLRTSRRAGCDLSSAQLAARMSLDARILERWNIYVESALTNSSKALSLLTNLADINSPTASQEPGSEQIDNLERKFSEILHREQTVPFAEKALAAAELIRLEADDLRTETGTNNRVLSWPSRSRRNRDFALPATGSRGPLLTNTLINGAHQPILHFEGQDILHVPQTVPVEGTACLLFKIGSTNDSGQRIIGWEDSNAGKHGVGLMTTAGGGLHALFRNDGMSGDIVASAPTNHDYQIVTLSWGPAGTILRRDGETLGTNQTTRGVSSDPEIKALKIGGPGSGDAAKFRGDIAEIRIYKRQLDPSEIVNVENQISNKWFNPKVEIGGPSEVEEFFADISSPRGPFALPKQERDEQFSSEFRVALIEKESARAASHKIAETPVPKAVAVEEGGPAKTPHEGFKDSPVFNRGNPKTPGKIVKRGIPRIFAAHDTKEIAHGSGRIELANWLASAENPLTARVMVNRVWQYHFGQGIVRTSGNFGLRGEPPSHPELLDYLAHQFIRAGWSLKTVHRLIMLSSTYQQSSVGDPATASADPENRLFGRMNLRRLDAEEIRDSLFSVTGKLDQKATGPGFQDLSNPRRSLYLMTVRTGSSASFGTLFDQPDGGRVVEKRDVSTVAPQALFWLNDPFLLEQAKALAARLDNERTSATSEQKLVHAYRLLYGRSPEPQELEIGLRFLANSSFESYCQILLCANEFIEVN